LETVSFSLESIDELDNHDDCENMVNWAKRIVDSDQKKTVYDRLVPKLCELQEYALVITIINDIPAEGARYFSNIFEGNTILPHTQIDRFLNQISDEALRNDIRLHCLPAILLNIGVV